LPPAAASGIVAYAFRRVEATARIRRPATPASVSSSCRVPHAAFRVDTRCQVKLSSRSEYGIRALLELAQRRGQGPIQSRDIAERQGIPDAYLNQLLLTLRKAGIVQSVRGPAGGHLLAKAPEGIS